MSTAPSRIFALCLLGLLVIATLFTGCIYWHIYGYEKMFGDFGVFRDAATHATTHQWDKIYDIERVRHITAMNNSRDVSFFLNPPTSLFLLYPLAFLSTIPALIVWSGVQLLLLLAVLNMEYIQHLFARPSPKDISAYLLLAITFLAFSLQNILFGQVSVFCAVLFLLVMAWRKPRPVWAGVMLGIFSFKPQLGLLLPLLLLAEGNWKTLFSAVVTAGAMALLSLLIWPVSLWHDYSTVLALRSQFLATDPSLLFTISTSAYAALRNLGISATDSIAFQTLLSVILLMGIWPIVRHGKETHKLLMLSIAAYLVTPYALIYDITLLALPCALLLRRAEADLGTRAELLALVLLILLPVVTILLQIHHIPYSVIAIGFTLIVASRLVTREQTPNP